uniref:Anaphase-promoting complex subunit 4 n=1 Tax=Kalanchoe fedtschenkoi TaxID=63787 RepID=A0A7N0VEL6_KALFE
MDTDQDHPVLPFQLQFEKPVASQIKIAEWNPEKDLLAMVTNDSKILLHRFNWQRLWTISTGKCVTSLCWRPDGKAVAVGLDDGTVALHDVENGKLMRSLKSHAVAVNCLNWEEDGPFLPAECVISASYEDRTSRFFPPAPRIPRMPGLVSGDGGFMDDNEDFPDLSGSAHQRFNILCSGDKEGTICFCIFGIIPVGKIDIHNLHISTKHVDTPVAYHLKNASVSKIALSKDLCRLVVVCSGELVKDSADTTNTHHLGHNGLGLHSLVLDTSIFRRRKNELNQVAQQASNIKDLNEVIRASLSVMRKQWSDAMHAFHEKFSSLSNLIMDNGLDSSPQEEFLSLLGGARTSPAIHQFLVNSLTEAGVKRISKAVGTAGKELQLIVLDHVQPAAEMIGFRMGELRGLSRWRARFKGIGLDAKLTNSATERAGMFLVQIERFQRVLSSVNEQFSNFFSWLLKCIKILMAEPSDQLQPFNTELVIIFLKFLYNQDPVRRLLECSVVEDSIEVDSQTTGRVKELIQFGGFLDCKYLQNTLAKEFELLETSFNVAFHMPSTVISKKILCEDFTSLFPLISIAKSDIVNIPSSIAYYKDASDTMANQSHQCGWVDYISFGIPDESLPDISNCVGLLRSTVDASVDIKTGYTSLESILLKIPDGYDLVDLYSYKESEIILLLNEKVSTSESSANAVMMSLRGSELPFVTLTQSTCLSTWILHELKDSVVEIKIENEKARTIPNLVVAPLAVSASRGVACVFTWRKSALVYILEEDEEEDGSTEEEYVALTLNK